jgi:hypothetical protein
MNKEMKYDFSSGDYAIWIESEEEAKPVLKKIEESHPKIICRRSSSKPSESIPFDGGFEVFLDRNYLDYNVTKGHAERMSMYETKQTITASEYLSQFEEDHISHEGKKVTISGMKGECEHTNGTHDLKETETFPWVIGSREWALNKMLQGELIFHPLEQIANTLIYYHMNWGDIYNQDNIICPRSMFFVDGYKLYQEPKQGTIGNCIINKTPFRFDERIWKFDDKGQPYCEYEGFTFNMMADVAVKNIETLVDIVEE